MFVNKSYEIDIASIVFISVLRRSIDDYLLGLSEITMSLFAAIFSRSTLYYAIKMPITLLQKEALIILLIFAQLIVKGKLSF